ncbi:hypothetical protein ES708_25704 [subsurface metagenome]
MKLGRLILVIAVLALVLSCASPPLDSEAPPDSELPSDSEPPPESEPPPDDTSPQTINGSLEDVEGVPILRLWGSPYEMGYAYGYLCASQIFESVERMFFWLEQNPNVTYEAMVDRMNRYILWHDIYIEEATACLAGMEAVLGSLPVITSDIIEAGSRKVDLEMLLLLNSFGHIMNVAQGCSGFAAWGEATGDGQTRAGGTVDSDRTTASQYLLVVRKPAYGLSTVCLSYSGLFLGGSVGPSKGMNETGLVMVTQGAYGYFNPAWTPVTDAGYTYVMLRDILEQVAASPDMVTNITEIFQESNSNFSGTLLFVQKSYTADNPQADQMAVVIEKDPFGFDVRLPSRNSLYDTPLREAIFATNYFLLRQIPPGYAPDADSVNRYRGMVAAAIDLVVSGLSEMQEVLQGAAVPGSIHSMYMEPDSLTIHIAFGTEEGPPSPYLTPVTFTWDELFAPIPD